MVNRMKKSTQIIGLPIINISEGSQLGKVKSLVINPEKGSVDFLTIEHDDWQVSMKAIPFKKIVGIGEYAVTIEAASAVIDLNEIPVANQLVNKKIKITNTKVLTRKGELLGDVQEFFVDQDTGHILGILLNVANNEVVLAADQVVTFGKDIIVVKEDASSQFLDSAELLVENTVEPHTNEEMDLANQDLQELKLKQIELLKGKRLVSDIVDGDGMLLFSKGTILTEQDIIKAQQKGPEVLVELSMNVEE